MIPCPRHATRLARALRKVVRLMEALPTHPQPHVIREQLDRAAVALAERLAEGTESVEVNGDA